MSKVNGFVELETQAVIGGCEIVLARIKQNRQNYKDQCVINFIAKVTKPKWYDKYFNIKRIAPSYDESIKMMDEISTKDFFGSTLDWKLKQWYREEEETMIEMKKAAALTETMLVSTEIAAKFTGACK